MKKRILRKQLIVNPALQYKLLFLILISILIPTCITFLTLFFLIQNILLEAQINNEVIYHALLFMSHKVYFILFTGFLSLTVLLVLWVTLFFHRIIGPLYRLENELDTMIQGGPIRKISFRKNDSLVPLANKINTLISMISKK